MEKSILKIEVACNTSDKTLLRNLESAKTRGVPIAPFSFTINPRPLLICGSGPSLKDYFKITYDFYKGECDVMALNGAYMTIMKMGIIPDYYVQLDARDENVNFVRWKHHNTKFLLASQCSPFVFDELDSYGVQMFHLNTPTTRKVFVKENVYYGGGSTVGLTSMGLACGLGYRNLALLGFDSSYKDGASHAEPQPQNAGQHKVDVWVEDRQYWAGTTMAKQVEEFRPWVQALERTFPEIDVRLFGEGLLYDYIMTGQRNTVSRETELSKYAEMYKHADYRMSEFRAVGVKQILSEREPCVLLDVGTGRGETIEIAESLGYIARGTETVPDLLNEKVTLAILPEIGFDSNTYDMVTCFEVIEHLLPGDVIPALRELERLARRSVIFSVCTSSDTRGGVELHPSWRSQREWELTFINAFGPMADVRCIGNLSSIDVSPVYEYRLRTP